MKSNAIYIIGAGGHAKVLLATLRIAGRNVSGLIETKEELIGTKILDVQVVSEDQLPEKDILLVNGVGSLGPNSQREKVFEKYKKLGYTFMQVIHPNAFIAEGVGLAEGVQVMVGCVIQPGVTVADNVIVNTGALVDHDCVIGKHVHLAPGVVLSGNVAVGDFSHLGTGAKVIQGINIGQKVMVAAGATIIKDVESCKKVAGTPAKIMD